MKMEAMPYYRWLVRDYRANRKVQRMGYVARGLYRELLDEEWIEGSLPTDMPSLAEICNCPVKVMEKAWPEISPCFQIEDGRLVNAKLESMRTEEDALRVKRAAAGRKGGIAKQVLASAKQVLADDEQLPYSREEHEQSNSNSREESSPSALFEPDSSNDSLRVRKREQEIVERMFMFYCESVGRDPSRYTLTEKRRDAALRRLRERCKIHGDLDAATADLAQAIENLAASEWHMREGQRDWVEQIFRSVEQFEKRLNWERPQGVINATPSPNEPPITAESLRITARNGSAGGGGAGKRDPAGVAAAVNGARTKVAVQ